jgi:hypothetical protein
LPGLGVRDHHGGILGQDGNSSLPFQVVGIHDALHYLLVGAEHAACFNKPSTNVVLPWFDMGNDGDIA